MLAADLTVKLDLPFTAVDGAFIERIVHEALSEAHVPVVDVEFDGVRSVDGPIPEQVGPVDVPGALAPYTRPPGARY